MSQVPAAPSAKSPVLKTATAAEIRDELQKRVLADLLGPAGGPEEEVDERNVRRRYILGMLAPLKQRVMPEEQDSLGSEENEAGQSEDGRADTDLPASGSMMPSSFGLSFSVAGDASAVQITASWGRYLRAPSGVTLDKSGKPKLIWKRSPVQGISPPIPLREGPIEPWAPSRDQPAVIVKGLIRRYQKDFIVSLFLINGQEEPERRRDENWLFQPELIVEAPDGASIFVRRHLGHDGVGLDPAVLAESQAMAMLYRHQVEFAVGHGVSVAVTPGLSEERERARRIATCVAPSYEVPRQDSPTTDDNPDLAGLNLDMKELAEAPPTELFNRLALLPQAYRSWIQRQRDKLKDPAAGLKPFRQATEDALGRCEAALVRIEEGLHLLRTDAQAQQAFCFANRAMWQQRIHTLFAEAVRREEAPDLAKIDQPQQRTWRTFQLAFVLINLPGLTNLHHADRSDAPEAIADLLWFPTGGGKTEAYLGLAAYTFGLRRLQGNVGGRSGEHGVAVLLRYTLRLLTLQQFQRAAALICACEQIRKEDPSGRWGEEPFRIGLWVGQRTTPNYTTQADNWLKDNRGTSRRGQPGVGSPAQLTNCPWCGHKIDPGHSSSMRVETDIGRTLVYCGNFLGNCPFTERAAPGEGIPVLVVDEEIFRLLPSMVIATVDKFAQLPWNGKTQMLFGQVSGRCTRHGFVAPDLGHDAESHPKKGMLPAARTEEHPLLRPPDLIIQDELHLISGPLGTLTGLYETAVDELCTWEVDGKRVRPKVVASTATIRRAEEQVHALFLRKVAVFPPHGLDVQDNFFSVQRTLKEQPGRLYLGVCAPGQRLKALLIRVYVAYLAAGWSLYQKFGRLADPYLTAVGYFSAMRELAGMRRLIEDDVSSRLRDTDRRGLSKRHRPIMEELTSRKSSTDIPHLLDRMEVAFTETTTAKTPIGDDSKRRPGPIRPLDVLLATNMISVGVDVKRLGLMLVCGQPKTTAEYIQATSRVGRSFPGLVCIIYNWTRPRDLSHFENFAHYHATFYQHVEALSVTPFSAGALERGLSALLVALIRLQDGRLSANDRAGALSPGDPIVQRVLATISRRAALVTGSKDTGEEVRKQLQRRLDDWYAEASRRAGGTVLSYRRKADGTSRELLKPAGLGPWEEFTCLNSLRDVEPVVGLVLDDRGMDEPPPASRTGGTQEVPSSPEVEVQR